MREDRLWKKVQKTDTCWLWTGSLRRSGYGNVMSWIDGKNYCMSAHKYFYLLLVGPVPEGLELDHLCQNRSCVNPKHLEPVTHSENIRRSPAARYAVSRSQSAKTHCPSGHPYSEENTYRNKGRRYCRVCMKQRLSS